QLHYCTAGLPNPFIIGHNYDTDKKLLGRGPALGLVKDKVYSEQVESIKKGDRLVFFTDGITELRSDGERLNLVNLLIRLARFRSKTPEQIISLIKERLIEVAGDKKAGDDITLLVVDIK
ncbi:MAG: PP2C family protein-serine/threonine phosphatase, partial [Bacillota bacterium]|nr:PP2C family protein-serine/threonine phosphatase [Bacillota bacterium]